MKAWDNDALYERALAALFSRTMNISPGRRILPFSEGDLSSISEALLQGHRERWSRVPRIYSVLRVISRISLLIEFISENISHLAFPFTQRTLPNFVKDPSIRARFLDIQYIVLTRSLDIEHESGKHCHFSTQAEVPFARIGELGKGSYGSVDHVRSTISHKCYARKLLRRARTFGKDNEVLRQFESEMAILKRLRDHHHIVKLVGSYTDSRFVGLVMSPVADCNLKEFLSGDSFSQDKLSILRTYFGCLSAAICYLHDQSIRHKDIKPHNILVKANHVLLTDFGQSLDWRESQHSTTSGYTLKTPKYCAPEVANYCPRNSSSDMWSLGCVFSRNMDCPS